MWSEDFLHDSAIILFLIDSLVALMYTMALHELTYSSLYTRCGAVELAASYVTLVCLCSLFFALLFLYQIAVTDQIFELWL